MTYKEIRKNKEIKAFIKRAGVSFQAKCKKVRYYRYFPLGRVTLN